MHWCGALVERGKVGRNFTHTLLGALFYGFWNTRFVVMLWVA
jgi:hypothetical protein